MSWKCGFVCLCVHFVLVLSCENYKWNPLVNHKKLIAGLILARGGSKGVKLKNISKVGGRTLLSISIDALKGTEGLSSIWVSTDNFLIAEEADKADVNTHWRTPESATDTATSIFAVQEFLKSHPHIDIVCLVQCTSPFIKSSYIQKALNLMTDNECVFSATRSFKLRWIEKDKELVPLNFDPKQRPRRQDFRGEVTENGMFYIATRELIHKGTFQSKRCLSDCLGGSQCKKSVLVEIATKLTQPFYFTTYTACCADL